MSQLPIADVLPLLIEQITHRPQVILKAEPGAGKSTYFPLQLLLSGCISGRIIMLEPRRLAARNIAAYLAKQLNEPVGQRVGFRVRGETKVSSATQLEIVTEGIMTRIIQNDPELDGVDMVIFDEFHERSIHADTALALSLEAQSVLRDDLKIVVMSATLDQQSLGRLLPESAYVESSGRQYPVELRYNPIKQGERLAPAMVKLIRSLLNSEQGSLLAFLPGVSAIKQVEEQLLGTLDDVVDVCPLYGQLDFKQQQKAISPAKDGRRKVVLATNIAETSLTIEGIRLVVDSGLERTASFDLKTGITRLQETKIAQSSAQQRAGRAGRLEPGLCVRLYSESQYQQQPKVPTPEILQSDLAPLAMELAAWGTTDETSLSWLDTPPKASLQQGRELLQQLCLMRSDYQLTAMGQDAHQLGLPPRTAAMLLQVQDDPLYFSAAVAAAVLLEEPEKNSLDISHSLYRWQEKRHPKSSWLYKRAQQLCFACDNEFNLATVTASQLSLVVAMAYPDRIAQLRDNSLGQFRLSNGHGAWIHESEPLANEHYLVVTELMRHQQQASQIFSAIALDIQQLENTFGALFKTSEVVDWDDKSGRLTAEKQTKMGQLVIQRIALPEPSKEKMTQALLNYVSRKGLGVLNWTQDTLAWLERVRCGIEWLPHEGWPAMDDDSLRSSVDDWLAPYLLGCTSAKQLHKVSVLEALSARLGWPLNQKIDEWLPTHHQMPTGTKKKIRYQQGMSPVLSVRMQEVFGEKQSPVIAQGTQTVVMELLSPAQRPLQVTQDLAGFWHGAYREVQKEMKGRYPKHVWPDDPANHVATTKTKRQLNS
ncbi:ATP-dependent helicase HrpB [Vibrio sp. CAIM 722]|uniref:ATP-dependent helicase HrpB n=1 Tax=Vibrio eleionomae TaxID=2653505 RepID=A0A7X4LJ34_9VIBR|nr:ATP-dependent helicase HrpB [Vibrio eleionomae]MZI92566.1 ATP-dependent helicase HrpB [Vibrio eleionomae]